jgi:hypothetical protein
MKLVDLEPTSQGILQVIGVLWGSLFCSVAFVLPRLFEAEREKKKLQQNQALMTCSFKTRSRQPSVPCGDHHSTTEEIIVPSKTNASVPSLTSFAVVEDISDIQSGNAEESPFSNDSSSNSDNLSRSAIHADDVNAIELQNPKYSVVQFSEADEQ